MNKHMLPQAVFDKYDYYCREVERITTELETRWLPELAPKHNKELQDAKRLREIYRRVIERGEYINEFEIVHISCGYCDQIILTVGYKSFQRFEYQIDNDVFDMFMPYIKLYWHELNSCFCSQEAQCNYYGLNDEAWAIAQGGDDVTPTD